MAARDKGPMRMPTVADIRLAHMTAGGYTGGNASNVSTRASIAPASTLNRQSPVYEMRKNVTADNRAIPIVYGEAQVGGLIFALNYDSTGDIFTIGYLLAQGEIESIESVYMDGETPPSGVTINSYTGAAGQTADPLLSAAISGYTDTLDGLAYVVIQFAAGVFDTWPEIVATIRGRKVYDPRTTLTAYSDNPALHLGDFLASSEYGLGFTVDDTALTAAANACDDATFGEVRRKSFVVIDRPQESAGWAETLRAYASCFVIYRGRTAYLVPDRPAASSATFTASDIVDGTMQIRRRSAENVPTVVQVLYTDAGNAGLWRERRADEAALPGVGSTVPRRVSQVRLPGITRHSQAYREAVERLNKLTLADLSIEFETFDEGLALEAGDVITVSHPYGLTSKQFRLSENPQLTTPGRWRITALEYDAAAYSDEVVPQPSTPDTTLPANSPPEPPVGLTLTEDSYQLQNGNYASRIRISWSASPSPFVTGYVVRVLEAGAVVWATTVDATTVATSPLQELVSYTVEVQAQTALYIGAAVSDSISLIGKTAIPDAPASLSGFEAGGEVRLNWPASTDIDAERYEVRYGLTAGDWDSAQVIDIVDGLRLTTREVPAGTWRFYVKTIDSINQYSTGAATLDVVVTLDNDAFLAGQLDPVNTHSGLTNIHQTVEVRGGSPVYYSDGGDSWMLMFSNAMNTYTDPLASYQSPVAAEWLGEELDLVQDQTGTFQATLPTTEVYTGTPFEGFQLKPDGGSYADQVGLSAKTSARYARLKVSGTSLFKVTMPSGSIRADILAQEETGSGTSAASGATTITLSRQYAAARSLVITPEATSARSAVFDNIVLDNSGFTTFDVYIFNSAGSQVATAFRYSFKGV